MQGGRDKENTPKMFSDFFFFYLVNVTQVTPETFTEDPSKLSFVYFFDFILGIKRLRTMSVQREMKTRKIGGLSELT